MTRRKAIALALLAAGVAMADKEDKLLKVLHLRTQSRGLLQLQAVCRTASRCLATGQRRRAALGLPLRQQMQSLRVKGPLDSSSLMFRSMPRQQYRPV